MTELAGDGSAPGIPGERLMRCSRIAAWAVAATGLLVLLGWMFDVQVFKSVLPSLPTMKANTALAFLLMGTAAAHLHKLNTVMTRVMVQLAAVAVALLGLLTLAESVLGWNLGLDQFLFGEAYQSAGSRFPGRMSPLTALNLILLAGGMLILASRRQTLRRIGDCAAYVAALAAILALAGHLYEAPALYHGSIYSSVAVHTAALFLVLALTLLTAPPIRGLAALLGGDDVGALLARRLLPVAIIVPPLVGYLWLVGQHHALFDTQFGFALFTTSTVVTFAVVIYIAADSLRLADQERRQSDRALQDSEQRFQLLINNAPDYATLMLDPGGRVVTWNEGARRLKGYDAEDIVGHHFSTFYTPEDVASGKPDDELIRAEANGTCEDEGWRVRKDGSRFWASVVIMALKDGQGRLRGFGKITHDLTERKRIEDARRESEQRLRAITDSLIDGLVVSTLEGAIFHWNKTALSLFGFDNSTAWSRKLAEFLDIFELVTLEGRVLELGEWPLARVIAGEKLHNVELLVRRVDVDWQRILTFSGAIVADDSGRSVAFLSFADVSERKRAEDALRDSEQRYRFLADAMPQIIWTAKPDGNLDYYNQQWYDYTGLTFEQTKDWGWKAVIHPDELPPCLDRWTQALKTGNKYEVEARFRRGADGAYRWHLSRAYARRDQQGAVVQWVGTCTDIDDQKCAAEVLRDAYSSLEQRVSERTSELAATLREREIMLLEIHHRVKNNLQVISSLINMQIREVKEGSSRIALQECQGRIQTIALIHEKLYQSKDYSRVPFSEYAQDLAANIFYASGVSPAAIALDLEIEPLSLAVDKAIPCGLLLNELITNALKHAFPDGRGGTVRVKLCKAGDREILLAVADDGIGMSGQFDPAQSKSLGVQLITTLVEQLDGRLEVTRSGGTTFSVTFPLEVQLDYRNPVQCSA